MIVFSHIVEDPSGMHARRVTQICAAARSWKSSVTVSYDGSSASALNLVELLALSVPPGGQIEVRIEGEDEDPCAQAMKEVFAF